MHLKGRKNSNHRINIFSLSAESAIRKIFYYKVFSDLFSSLQICETPTFFTTIMYVYNLLVLIY